MKVCAIFIVLLLFSIRIEAQTDYGIKGGLNFTFYKIDEGNFGDNPDAEIGYYGGFFVDFNVEKGFHLSPELLYIRINDFKFLNVPIHLKYDVNQDLHILVGPSFNYFFDFFSNKFKVRADLSLAYDLSSKLNLHMKYTIGFEEFLPNILFLGLGYKL